MRTNLDRAFRRRSRGALAALVSISALATPLTAAGQAIVRPKAETADFEKFLPSVAPVPWLEASGRVPRKNIAPLPQAGSVNALLFAPAPAASWTPSQAASASIDFARM